MSASTTVNEDKVSSMLIRQEIAIAAPIELAWEAVLEQTGPKCEMPDGTPFPFKLEAWPGGRLYRETGDSAGHLWGYVQVIKPPRLLEIWGPMMMSYPAVNHLQYRLTVQGENVLLELTHRAMGMIDAQHRDGLPKGFEFWMQRIKHLAETR